MADIRPRVVRLQRKHGEIVQGCTLYIGRMCARGGWDFAKSDWANPFVEGKDGDRHEILRKYEQYLRGRPKLLKRLPELTNQILGCWCDPKPCHGHVLQKLYDEWMEETRKENESEDLRLS